MLTLAMVMTGGALAEQRTFYDSFGNVVGRSSTNSSGTTTNYDFQRQGDQPRFTSGNRTTNYDAAGRLVGRWPMTTYPQKITFGEMRESGVREVLVPEHHVITLLTDLPPTRRQTRAAIAVVLIVIVAFAVVAPFSGRQAATLNAFFPSLDAIVLVTDLITAVILYAQFSISRSRSLLVLASGYLFTAFIVIPHALTFSGAFSPTGLFGAGLQTGSWLFIFWHIGFAAALLGYAISRDMKRGRLAAETAVVREISWSVVTVVALVSGIAWLTTGGEALLPPIILDTSRLSPFVIYPIWFTILITAAGLVILVFRRRSVLDLWLIVVAAVFIGELAFSGLLPTVRFSVGFYAGRVFSLVTSSIVLIVLLSRDDVTLRPFSSVERSAAARATQQAHEHGSNGRLDRHTS